MKKILIFILLIFALSLSAEIQTPINQAGLIGSWSLSKSDLCEGADLVTNGDFATDTDWDKVGQFTIHDGYADLTCDGTYSVLGQDIGGVVGKTYVINFDATLTTGVIDIFFGSDINDYKVGTIVDGTNSIIHTWLDSGSSILRLKRIGGATNIQIDNVIVKEIDSSFKDKSGNGNDGTSANAPVFTADQNGVTDQAITQNGTTDKVTIGNVSNIKSFSIWIYPTANTRSIADFDGGTISAEIDASDNITATGWTAPTIYVNGIASDDITLNVWNFITITSGTSVNATVFVLGNEATWFVGSLDDVNTYSSALTSDQVNKLYLAGRTTAKIKEDVTNPNKITPKLQKGLILDMPLAEPYTEGNDVTGDTTDAGNWAFDGTYPNNGSSGFETQSEGKVEIIASNGNYINSKYAGYTFLPNKKYQIKIAIIENDLVYAANTIIRKTGIFYGEDNYFPTGTTGTYTYDLITLNTISNNYIWSFLSNSETTAKHVVYKIDSIVELDGTAKDRTPYGNDGTVSGATIKHNGLVNTGDGIAYINSDTAYGTWEFDISKFEDPSMTQALFISDLSTVGIGSYSVRFDIDESVKFVRPGGAVEWSTAINYITINTDYRIKITRSLADVFTVYIKGGSFGWDDWQLVGDTNGDGIMNSSDADWGSGTNPFTNNDYTTSNYFVADLDNGDTISNLKIDGKRISLMDAIQSTGTWTTTSDSYDFDGSGYISLPSSYNSIFQSDFTISVWINPNDGQPASTLDIFGDYTDSNGKQIFQLIDNGKLVYYFFGNGDVESIMTDNVIFSDGVVDYKHILITGDQSAAELKMYVDGELVPTTISGTITSANWALYNSTTNHYYIGAATASGTFDGQISGMKIYNRILSTNEIESLYRRGNE